MGMVGLGVESGMGMGIWMVGRLSVWSGCVGLGVVVGTIAHVVAGAVGIGDVVVVEAEGGSS